MHDNTRQKYNSSLSQTNIQMHNKRAPVFIRQQIETNILQMPT